MQNQSKLNRNRSWWSDVEDDKLRRQMNSSGKQSWKIVAKESGLKRSPNSCRLRWENHLKPGTRPGWKLTNEEKLLILELRSQWGGKNCWSKIAKHLVRGRRDNDVKNFWHTLAKRAKQEGRDVESDASLKRAELVETIKAAGKFSIDYASIRPVGYNKLKELLPDVAVAGEMTDNSTGAVSSADCGSDFGPHSNSYNDLASSSAAIDIATADAVTSCYSVEFDPGRVGYSDISNIVPTTKVDPLILQEQFLEAFRFNTGTPQPLVNRGLVDHGGGPTGYNQVPAAALDSVPAETSNQGSTHIQAVAGEMTDNIGAVSSADCGSDFGPSSNSYNDFASSSATTDIGGAEAVTSVEFGPGRVGYSDISDTVATMEVDPIILQEQFLEALIGFNPVPAAESGSTPPERDNPDQKLIYSGLVYHGGGPTGFNQVPVPPSETSNQGWTHIQGSGHQEHLGFKSEGFYLGGGPSEFNQATAAALRDMGRFYL